MLLILKLTDVNYEHDNKNFKNWIFLMRGRVNDSISYMTVVILVVVSISFYLQFLNSFLSECFNSGIISIHKSRSMEFDIVFLITKHREVGH